MIVILFTWFLLVCYGIKKNNSGVKPFEPTQALALRGICAIEIMMGHIGIETGSRVLYPNRKAGILFVGIFFLLSGYGVAYSTENKKDYLKNFLLNRSIRLLLPAYLTKILMISLRTLLLDRRIFTGIDVKQFLFVLNWYVWEQLLFYLIYYLAYKVMHKHVEIAVGICSVVLIIAAYVSGLDNPWYGSSLCFLLGLCYYKLEKRNIKLTNIRYYTLLGILAVVLIGSVAAFFALGNDNVLGNPVARNIASMSFCMMIVMLLYRFRIGNPISVFLGKCSYEIFLLHPYVLSVLKVVPVESKNVLGILTVVMTIFLAYIIHWLLGLFRSLYKPSN